MSNAILSGAVLSTGTLIQVDATASLVGYKLIVSNCIKSTHKKIKYVWDNPNTYIVATLDNINTTKDRSPPTLLTLNTIAINLSSRLDGDFCLGGKLWL